MLTTERNRLHYRLCWVTSKISHRSNWAGPSWLSWLFKLITRRNNLVALRHTLLNQLDSLFKSGTKNRHVRKLTTIDGHANLTLDLGVLVASVHFERLAKSDLWQVIHLPRLYGSSLCTRFRFEP